MYDLVVIKGPNPKKWAIWSRRRQCYEFARREWPTKRAAELYLEKYINKMAKLGKPVEWF